MRDAPTPLSFFRQLSGIPRISGHEKAAADFVQRIAEAAGCRVYRDRMDNLIVTKAGSPGHEDAPPFMLQGHLDMVGAAAPGVIHDFTADPIALTEENGILRAKGTTLGGDDGIAVAIMLCLLTDPALTHPPLECVFTVQEETGLSGAMALDTSRLKARRMLNLDAGPEGIFVTSCAGGCRAALTRPLTWEKTEAPMWKLEVSGLEGGHSGGNIGREGANALVLCGIVLDAVLEHRGRIGTVTGGDKDNAIPVSAEAFFALGTDPRPVLEPLAQKIREAWHSTDPHLQIRITPAAGGSVLKTPDAKALVSLLRLLPHGVYSHSRLFPQLPEVSANLASVRLDRSLQIGLSLRSSSDFRKEQLMENIRLLAQCFGAEYSFTGVYPGWSPAARSPLCEQAIQAFETVYGHPPQLQGIHAGLECGVFKQAIPELDMIATGPRYGDMHTPSEWMDIASMTRLYDFVKELLRMCADQ